GTPPVLLSAPFASGPVAFDGTNFVVFTGEGSHARIYRLAPDGTPVDAAPIPVDASGNADGIACIGATCLLLFDKEINPNSWQADVVREQSGVVIDATPTVLFTDPGSLDHTFTIKANATDFLVTGLPFSTGGFFEMNLLVVVGADGAVVAPPVGVPLLTSSVAFQTDATATGFLMAWGDDDALLAVRIGDDGAIVDSPPMPLLVGTNADVTPAVAFDGAQYLVVWADDRTGYDNIWGARVGLDGAPIDATPFAIGSAAANQTSPAVAFDGTNFVVAWVDARDNADGDIYAARVSQAGAVLDPQGLAVDTGQADAFPAIAARPGGTILVWSNTISFGPDEEDGALLDTTGAITTGPTRLFDVTAVEQFATAASVGWNGTDFVVAYATESAAKFARVDASLQLEGTTSLGASSQFGAITPLVCNAGDCVVAWGVGTLRAAHVAADGTVTPSGGQRVVSLLQSAAESPSLVFDGDHYVLSYRDSYGYGMFAQFLDPVSLAPALPPAQTFAVSTRDTLDPPVTASSGNHDVLYVMTDYPTRLIEDYVMTDDVVASSTSSTASGTSSSGTGASTGASTSGSGAGQTSSASGATSSTGGPATSASSVGTSTGTGGKSSGAGGGDAAADDSSGCSCRTAEADAPTAPAALAALLTAALLAARRAARRRQPGKRRCR
ncbi:MAG TPA: MYXO-CTERM sorting domain-containing protein, partial [Byssovorax sp.]